MFKKEMITKGAVHHAESDDEHFVSSAEEDSLSDTEPGNSRLLKLGKKVSEVNEDESPKKKKSVSFNDDGFFKQENRKRSLSRENSLL